MFGRRNCVPGVVGTFTMVDGLFVIEAVGVWSSAVEDASISEVVGAFDEVDGASVTEAACGVIDVNSDDDVVIAYVMFLVLLTVTVVWSLELNVSDVTEVTFNDSTPVMLAVGAIGGKLLMESEVSRVTFEDVVEVSSSYIGVVPPLGRIKKINKYRFLGKMWKV